MLYIYEYEFIGIVEAKKFDKDVVSDLSHAKEYSRQAGEANGVRPLTNVTKKIQIGPFGNQLHKKDYVSGGIPLVNPTHIQWSIIVPDYDFAVSKKKYRELSNYVLLLGDIVLGRRGEMGRCALVTSKENKWLCGRGSLFIRPTRKIVSKYLFIVLSSEQIKQFLEEKSKGITMKNLNSSIIGNIPIPVPQRLEQKEIIKRVQILFRKIDKVEKQYQQLKKTSSELPQAILSKAYSGKLIPQNPKDEPVDKLLERIREEKAKLFEERKELRTTRARKKAGRTIMAERKRKELLEVTEAISRKTKESTLSGLSVLL